MKQLLPSAILLTSLLLPMDVRAESAPLPSFERTGIFRAEEVARSIPLPATGYFTERQAAGLRSWKKSLIPLIAAQSLDIASSYGMRERNPLLAGTDGRFGARAAGVKVGVTAAIVGVEAVVVKKWPGAARMLSKLNWSSAALTGGIAAHNFAIK